MIIMAAVGRSGILSITAGLLLCGPSVLPFAWRHRIFLRRSFFLLGIMIVVAAALPPMALYVQSQAGGYAALAAYQRTMLNRHWLTNLSWQAQNQLFFEGWLSRASVPVAYLCISLVSPQRAEQTLRFFLILLLLFVSTLLIGSSGTAVL
jgi:hypothetical protein